MLSERQVERLVGRAKVGDEDAFAEICINYAGLRRWVCNQWGYSHVDEEELMQETMIGLWTCVQQWRGDACFTTSAVAFMRNSVRGQNYIKVMDRHVDSVDPMVLQALQAF
jgi:DNA-directed RNA polymerase specialized sigma24 family protein